MILNDGYDKLYMDNYEKSRQKWKELIKKIFGTENITWRLEPTSGQIFFSTNGVERIKSKIVFIATTRSSDKTKWTWAWAGNKRTLRLLPDENRIDPEDISDYIKDGGEFEEKTLFTSECVVLANTDRGRYYLKYMRAKVLSMFEGQFIFEGDMNGSNAIFVILKAKGIKQIAPETENDQTETPEVQSQTRKNQEDKETSENSNKQEVAKQTKKSIKSSESRESQESDGSDD